MSDGLHAKVDDRVVLDWLARTAVAVKPKALTIVTHFGQRLLTGVKAHTSGRPGPNIVTGEYQRSWTLDVTEGLMGPTARAGTDAPQAKRLEFGFNGVDSLGRRYRQPPYAHAGPAYDEIVPEFESAVALFVDELA